MKRRKDKERWRSRYVGKVIEKMIEGAVKGFNLIEVVKDGSKVRGMLTNVGIKRVAQRDEKVIDGAVEGTLIAVLHAQQVSKDVVTSKRKALADVIEVSSLANEAPEGLNLERTVVIGLRVEEDADLDRHRLKEPFLPHAECDAVFHEPRLLRAKEKVVDPFKRLCIRSHNLPEQCNESP